MKVKAREFGATAGGQYDVWHNDEQEVTTLVCLLCSSAHAFPFTVHRMEYQRGGDRSGQGRYNRMRAAMVKHLHACHRAEIAVQEEKVSDER